MKPECQSCHWKGQTDRGSHICNYMFEGCHYISRHEYNRLCDELAELKKLVGEEKPELKKFVDRISVFEMIKW